MDSAENEKQGTTRRVFFKGIAAGAAGATVLSPFAWEAAASPSPQRAKEELITVFNPLGQPPPLALLPLAPRLGTLKGKTIYVVDTKFPASKTFYEEFVRILKEKYPDTIWVPREKIGSYFDDDPKLWAEIKEKGHGMIIMVGH
jgi:hypothetical protein